MTSPRHCPTWIYVDGFISSRRACTCKQTYNLGTDGLASRTDRSFYNAVVRLALSWPSRATSNMTPASILKHRAGQPQLAPVAGSNPAIAYRRQEHPRRRAAGDENDSAFYGFIRGLINLWLFPYAVLASLGLSIQANQRS